VVAPDLRGFGESEGTPSSIDGFAEDLHGLIELLGLPAIVLGGFSMGGYVLLRYLAHHADRVKGVLLISTRADGDTPEVRESRAATIERLKTEGPDKYLADFARRVVAPLTLESDPGVVAKVRRLMGTPRVESLIGALKAVAERPDSTPLLGSIAVPTLVVAGADDRVIPVTVARAMAAAIPGAKSVIIKEAGHMVNLEQSDQFAATLREFYTHLPAS